MAEIGTGNTSNFFNLFGIFFTILMGILLLFLFSWSLAFLKLIMYKLRLVLKNASLKEKSYFPTIKHKTPRYKKASIFLKHEILKSWNLKFINVFLITLSWYNHLFYWILCSWWHREKNNVNLLKPRISFYALTWCISVFLFWTQALFLSNIVRKDSYIDGIW